MRFDHVGDVEEVVFQMRETDQTRAEDRAVLLRLYGGRPPVL